MRCVEWEQNFETTVNQISTEIHTYKNTYDQLHDQLSVQQSRMVDEYREFTAQQNTAKQEFEDIKRKFACVKNDYKMFDEEQRKKLENLNLVTGILFTHESFKTYLRLYGTLVDAEQSQLAQCIIMTYIERIQYIKKTPRGKNIKLNRVESIFRSDTDNALKILNEQIDPKNNNENINTEAVKELMKKIETYRDSTNCKEIVETRNKIQNSKGLYNSNTI